MAITVGSTLSERDFQRQIAATRLQATETSEHIEERVRAYFSAIEIASLSLTAIVSSNPNIGAEEFAQVCERLLQSLPDVMNVAAAPGNVVSQVYPFEPNQAVIGLDYRNDPAVMAIIARSRMTRSPQIQGPVSLVQGGEGFIVRSAIHVAEEELGIERYWGVIALVIEFDRMVESIGVLQEYEGWDVTLARVDAAGQLGQRIFGTGEIFSESAVRSQVSGLGTEWEIYVLPENGWPESSQNSKATWLLVLGTAAFLLLNVHTFMRLFFERETARRQLIQAIENLNDGFALFDKDDRLVLCNQRYRDFYRRSADLFVPGAHFDEIIREGVARGQYPEAQGNEDQWITDRLDAHKKGDTEIEQLLDDGRHLRIAERKTPDGGTVGFRVDITELKRAIEQANAANEAKSEFLQVISHELRTPLTAVIGFLTFLSKPEVLPAAQRTQAAIANVQNDRQALGRIFAEHLEEISGFARRAQASSEHLMTLIGDVLEWSKLEQHSVKLNVQHVNSKDLAGGLFHQFEQLATSKGLEFLMRIEDFDFDADPDRLRQVLINLVGNATKFTREGQVVLIAERVEHKAVFKVQDSGPGIHPKDQEKLFDRFFQADSSLTRAHGGVGLGLSISKYLVELHRGEISVFSEVGKGSEFQVSIPLHHCRSNSIPADGGIDVSQAG
jgi:signal transduction histidine kinase